MKINVLLYGFETSRCIIRGRVCQTYHLQPLRKLLWWNSLIEPATNFSSEASG